MLHKVRKRKGYFLLLFAFGISCAPKGTSITLDNPLPEAIEVRLDGKKKVLLPAFLSQSVTLSKGKHSFESFRKDKTLLDKGVFSITENEGLLNVTRTPYILWKIVFSRNQEGLGVSPVVSEDTIRINDKKYVGPFMLYPDRQVFIPKSWELGVQENVSDSVNIPADKEYLLVTKLYRAEDFTQEYQRFYAPNPTKINEYLDKVLQEK